MALQKEFISSGLVEAEGIVAFRNIIVDDLPTTIIIPALSRVTLTDGNTIDDINASAILANSWTAGYIRLFLDGVLVTVFPPLVTHVSTTKQTTALSAILEAQAAAAVFSTPATAASTLADTGVVAGTYLNPTVTVGADGRIISIRDGTPEDINLNGDVFGAPTTNQLVNSGVVAGAYLNTNLTVDAKGRITAAASGSNGAFIFIGGWDAATNTPVIPPATPINQGWTYLVTVASIGVTAFPNVQNTTYAINDYLISNGATMWIKQNNVGGGLTAATHEALNQLIHFLSDGPGKGFVTGAFKETLPAASPFPTSVIWWTDAGKTVRIVEKLITYTGILPTTIVWNVYDSLDVLQESATDVINYSGVFETDRTRTIV
jgi:hypothetical protein